MAPPAAFAAESQPKYCRNRRLLVCTIFLNIQGEGRRLRTDEFAREYQIRKFDTRNSRKYQKRFTGAPSGKA
jgi:hypothetical protein